MQPKSVPEFKVGTTKDGKSRLNERSKCWWLKMKSKNVCGSEVARKKGNHTSVPGTTGRFHPFFLWPKWGEPSRYPSVPLMPNLPHAGAVASPVWAACFLALLKIC